MTLYLLCVAVLGQAPIVEPCGGVASCVRVGVPDGGQVQLGGVLQSSRYATPDGGGAQVRIQPLTTDVPVAVLGNQSRTSTNPDVIIGGTVSRDGGQGPLVSFVSGNNVVATMSTIGTLSATSGVSPGVLLSQDGGTVPNVCQFGYSALSNGDAGIVFRRAFSSLPQCQCTHVATTNANACVISTAPSASAVGFSSQSADTDVIDWQCCGAL